MKSNIWKKIIFSCFVLGLLGMCIMQGVGKKAAPSNTEAGLVAEDTTENTISNNSKEHTSENSTGSNNQKEAHISQPGRENTSAEKGNNENKFTEIVMHIKRVFPARSSSKNKRNTQNNRVAQNNASKATARAEKKKSSNDGKTKSGNQEEKKNSNSSNKSSKKSSSKKAADKKNANKNAEKKKDKSTENNPTDENSSEEGTQEEITCTIMISCVSLLDNIDKLPAEKRGVVPENGLFLETVPVTVKKGSTVFDVLKMVTENNNIQLEYSFSPAYKTYYVEGIGNLYAFDAGKTSGWMYSVNNEFSGYGCSAREVAEGDEIKWLYTCSFGRDVGAYVEE